MYEKIYLDYLQGLSDALKIRPTIKLVYNDQKIQKLWIKVIKYNMIIYLIRWIASFYFYLSFLEYLMIIFNSLFHLLHYLDLIRLTSHYATRANLPISALDNMALAIVMSSYQFVVYLTTQLVSFILRSNYLSYVINFYILSTYHSLYCFNHLWQHKKVELFHRIDIHEKLWPYYLGYGMIITIIYLFGSCPFALVIYNTYLMHLLMVPFLVPTRFPTTQRSYPSISLRFFSYLTSIFLWLGSLLVGRQSNTAINE